MITLPAFVVVAATAFGVLVDLPPVYSQAPCDEFFYLVQQWGPTFCKHERQPCQVEPVSSHFTLHGLWPNYEKGRCPGKKGAWPQNCDDSSTELPPECDCPFDLSLLADLQSSMLENWPSYGQTNARFWQHEWDKHGSCAITYEQEIGGPVTSQHQYFDKALQLREQCNVLESLKAVGISPGSNAPARDFLAAVKEGCGVSPQIACHPGSSDLEEFRFCYDDEFRAMDCQQGKEVEDCRRDQITLPVWRQTSTAAA
ncbi:hypothetical protein ABBQ32_002793 [Trebouxia sp. C0010 RCD-2024]